MSSEQIRPSTIVGIKRLAKTLKAEQGIQHAKALDVAAVSAGYQNYRHASNVLAATPTKQPQPTPTGHQVYLTSSWYESGAKSSGREILTITLETPLDKLITKYHLAHRWLRGFTIVESDYLANYTPMRSQTDARRSVCAAARTLQFMDATQLKPSRGYPKSVKATHHRYGLPGLDHFSAWYDPNSKRHLVTDEPYEAAAKSKAKERSAWATQYSQTILRPDWAGMYAPDGGSQLYLVSDNEKGIPLEPIVAALNALPAPIVPANWNGESTSLLKVFVSPAGKAAADTTKRSTTPRSKATRAPSKGVKPMGAARMPIEAHAEVGRLLQEVFDASYYRKGVYNRLMGIRSHLDDWVQREYTSEELPYERFTGLYYCESDESPVRKLADEDRKRHLGGIDQVKQLLARHYPDSAALRGVLKKLDAVAKSLEGWR